MSVDHKRPLLAFAVVTIACVVILVNAVRSEAFVSLLRAETSHVVAGLGLAPADHRPAHRLEREPEAALLVDAPEVVAPVQHRTGPRPAGHRPRSAARRRDARASGAARGGDAHERGEHARGHDGDPDGRRVHRHGREHGHHRGHGDDADHAPRTATAATAARDARELGHSRYRPPSLRRGRPARLTTPGRHANWCDDDRNG